MFNKEQSQNTVFDCDIETVFHAVQAAAGKLSGFKVKLADSNFYTLKIGVSVSLFSWGEQINVHLRRLEDGRTEAQISSDSNLGIEFAAKSKNRKNIEKLIAETEKICAQPR